MAKVLWFTGLSGSGKSTIAERMIPSLRKAGKTYEIHDGDEVRRKLHKHLGFTREDILENNRLIVELCKKSFGKFDFLIVPIISPFKISRENARKEFGDNFIEIFVDCDYEECKKRDVKGLYKKAESGDLKNFIGLQIPYEKPEKPEIIINSKEESLDESVKRILNYLNLEFSD